MYGFWKKLSYFAIWITVLNDLLNALGVYLILGVQAGAINR